MMTYKKRTIMKLKIQKKMKLEMMSLRLDEDENMRHKK